MLGKFIECGLVLQNISLAKTSWMSQVRRYPTTNCSVEQLKGLSLVLKTTSKILETCPDLYDKVEETLRNVHPTAIGRGLIWLFNQSTAQEIPAPKGVRRLLIKVLHGGAREQRLFRSVLTSIKTDGGDSLTKNILEFQHVIRQFATCWHI